MDASWTDTTHPEGVSSPSVQSTFPSITTKDREEQGSPARGGAGAFSSLHGFYVPTPIA
ncbi:MAG TPA: hypothetical protein VLV86_02415 [Vicinamibacterales bacterium]|nr:hypothetical protein [Vicinamibacterales bacterium]